MKWLIILLVPAWISCSEQVIICESEISSDVFYSPGSGDPFTGKCLVNYTGSDQIKEEFRYKNGLLEGMFASYYSSGKMHRKGQYRKGKMNGKWEMWSENGTRLLEAAYVDDMLEGSFTIYHSNGKVKESGEYVANRRSPNWKYYAEDGSPLAASELQR